MTQTMTKIDRRAMIAASGAALLLPSALGAQSLIGNRPAPFSWERLVAQAQQLTRTPFKETPAHPGAAKVDYIAQHEARFRDERTLWGDLPGDTGIRFFPLSQYSTQPVTIATVDNGRATPLRYDPDMFDAPAGNAVKALGPDAGFAGFRIMNAARDGDWLSFLGASYFRAPSPQKQFGLSARAIAINTSLGKEEFPRFTHFWLERTGEHGVTIYALLDGASITGAYRFVSSLGADGVHQDVTAALFPRRPIEELGLMAMTSMFWYDQANRGKGTDWRPEIHDSDILSIASADGTAHARPIINPPTPLVSAFAERDPRGFGLVQRDRDFDHYQDDGVYYDRRPTLWATPTRALGRALHAALRYAAVHAYARRGDDGPLPVALRAAGAASQQRQGLPARHADARHADEVRRLRDAPGRQVAPRHLDGARPDQVRLRPQLRRARRRAGDVRPPLPQREVRGELAPRRRDHPRLGER